jgi:hypothetical protein
MGLRRAPGMIQGAARGAMQGVMQAPSTMREALMQTQPQQGVAEILSQGLPEMTPDLGGATSAASRQRQIADMLLQGAQSQDNTSIAGGLSQLGQAFLARKAGQKADTAETEREQITRDLLARATGGGPDAAQARAQLEGGDVASALTRYDAQQAAAQAAQQEQARLTALQNMPGITDQQRALLAAGVGADEAGKMAFAPPPEAASPSSSLGKIAADLKAGFITQEQADAAIAKATAQSAGVRVNADGSVQVGGPVDGIGYGSAARGQEPAFVRTREGGTAVTPGPQQEAYNKARRGVDEFMAQNSIVLGDIDMALKNVSVFSTGAGSALKDLPIFGGITPAGQMESLMETIRANVGFDKLQAMREASPTGGALGSVTEKELAFLQAVFGSLRQDISPENVTRNLTRLKEHMLGREQRIRDAFAADFPTIEETAQFRTQTNEQVQRLKYNVETGEFE